MALKSHNIKVPRYKSFGKELTTIVDDHKRMIEEEEAAKRDAERNERARRQFLLFLFFAIQATSIIFRDEINAATASLYNRITRGDRLNPTHKAFASAEAKVKAVTQDASRRKAALDEIAPGLGGDEAEVKPDTAVDLDHPGRNALLIKEQSKRRQKVLDDIVPGMGSNASDSPPRQ